MEPTWVTYDFKEYLSFLPNWHLKTNYATDAAQDQDLPLGPAISLQIEFHP